MRTYEQFIEQYGTEEEKRFLYSDDGQEFIGSIQEQRIWDSLSSEQKYEIQCGCETIDTYLTDSDLSYWRKAGKRAAQIIDMGFVDFFLDEDDEDDRLIMEDLGLL